jgi:hypothetical protein
MLSSGLRNSGDGLGSICTGRAVPVLQGVVVDYRKKEIKRQYSNNSETGYFSFCKLIMTTPHSTREILGVNIAAKIQLL